jgi:hypothetical protein
MLLYKEEGVSVNSISTHFFMRKNFVFIKLLGLLDNYGFDVRVTYRGR